jgi:hypothetical protein
MSLQLAAKHLAAHGRGKDTELIHMDKGEIASLQQIAMAHGGSLTINPQTGLPEAGFLSAMLPMIAGAGLMAMGVPNPMMAGLIVGGLRTAQSGDLKKGIMAGFGAYGGAGLASSFGTAGAVSQAAPSAGQAVAADTDAMAQAAQATQTPISAVPNMASTNVATGVGSYPASVYTPTDAPAGIGGINGNTMTNAESFGASSPNAGMPPTTQGISTTTPQGTTFPGESAMQGTSYAGPSMPKSFADMTPSERISAMGRGASFENAYDYAAANPKSSLVAATGVAMGMKKDPVKVEPDKDMGQRYSFTGGKYEPAPAPDVPTYDQMMYGGGNFGRQQKYFKQPTYSPISADAAKGLYNFADGGMPVEQMSNNAMMGVNTMYPMANISTSSYGTPDQMAEGGEAESRPSYTYDPQSRQYQQMASGGISDARYNLGGYSDGGRLLRGPGDGVSDSIPAVIGKKQPARLADGEFVVPARIVSELGNGSTEAGARKLYAMLDRVQASRKHTVGKGKVAKNNRADKYLPA